MYPKPPKVGLSTSLHGPAYTGETLPIVITLENGEMEAVALHIQFEIPELENEDQLLESPRNMFQWLDSSNPAISGNVLEIGEITPGERRDSTILFKPPSAPTERSLGLVIKYFLRSDPKTEVVKRALLDIPVIQPLQTTFDIFPQVARNSGMPNIFHEGPNSLPVAQMWRLCASISRIGSDMLELKNIRILGECEAEGSQLDIAATSSSAEEISSISNSKEAKSSP